MRELNLHDVESLATYHDEVRVSMMCEHDVVGVSVHVCHLPATPPSEHAVLLCMLNCRKVLCTAVLLYCTR